MASAASEPSYSSSAAAGAAGAGAGAIPTPTAPYTPFDERDLAGRVVLITGASRGLGAEMAKQLGRRKASLILLARAATSLEATSKAVQEAGGPAPDCRGCDVSDAAAVKALFADLDSKYPKLDVLILNAGVMPGLGMPPPAVSDDADIACFRTNVEGYHFVTKYALPMMVRAQDGFERTVLFVGSNEGWLTEPTDANGMLAYRASKAATNGLMVALHQLYVKNGMMEAMIRGGEDACLHRVVSAHPGYVKTGLGFETAREMEPDITPEEHAKRKDWEEDFLDVEKGADTLLWLVAASNGTVESGKTYHLREVHSF